MSYSYDRRSHVVRVSATPGEMLEDLDRELAKVKRELHLEVLAPLKGLVSLMDEGVFLYKGKPHPKIQSILEEALKGAERVDAALVDLDFLP